MSARFHWCTAEADSDRAAPAAWPLPSCSASNIPAPSEPSPCSLLRLEPKQSHVKIKQNPEEDPAGIRGYKYFLLVFKCFFYNALPSSLLHEKNYTDSFDFSSIKRQK